MFESIDGGDPAMWDISDIIVIKKAQQSLDVAVCIWTDAPTQ